MELPTLIKKIRRSPIWKSFRKKWYRFKQDPLALIGLVIVSFSIIAALIPSVIAPYPDEAFLYLDYENSLKAPSFPHPFGTDRRGRDVLTRSIFGFRYSLRMAVVVLSIAVPPGVLLGLFAGYKRGTWIDQVIMRAADIFIAVPALVLALAICSVLEPNVFNAMMAVTLLWWPWYTRLTYNQASSIRNEYYVVAAELTGAPASHIMFKEILPNCAGPILTKLTLDVGWVILIGATLSFLGLGAQPPTPDLGTMASDGLTYMPTYWWVSIFPSLVIAFIVLGFNLLGDGINNTFIQREKV